MDHSYYKERVSAWIDQELPPYEQEALTQHLAECDECKALAAKLRQVDRLMEGRSELGGSEEYWEQLARKTEARIGINQDSNVTSIKTARKSSDSGLRWKVFAAAASVAVLTFVGWHQQDIFRDMFSEETAPSNVLYRIEAPALADSIDQLSSEESDMGERASKIEAQEAQRNEEPVPPAQDADLLHDLGTKPSGQIQRAAPVPAPVADEGAGEDVAIPVRPKADAVAGRDDRAAEKKTKLESSAKDLKEQFLGKAAQIKPQSVAETESAGNFELKSTLAEVDSSRELVYWQNMRDSLLVIYPIDDTVTDKPRKNVRQQGQAAGSNEIADSLLAEALFNVARLSNDQAEFDECVRQLNIISQQAHQNTAVQRNFQNVQELKK